MHLRAPDESILHTTAAVEPYVENAAERGIDEIGSTEHVEPYPWDYLLGSVHFVDGLGVDARPALVDEIGSDTAWSRYFDWLNSGLSHAAGYDTVTVFDGRRARQEPLG